MKLRKRYLTAWVFILSLLERQIANSDLMQLVAGSKISSIYRQNMSHQALVPRQILVQRMIFLTVCSTMPTPAGMESQI